MTRRKNDSNMYRNSFLLYSAPTSSSSSESSETKSSKNKVWYPVKPTDALTSKYDSLVRSAYCRHVLVETREMADLALKLYLKGGSSSNASDENSPLSSADPFGSMARDVSICATTREEGGKIGWINNPGHNDNINNEDCNEVVSTLVPKDVIDALFQMKPKGGDVFTIPSSQEGVDGKEKTMRWHLVRVDDILIDYLPNSNDKDKGEEALLPIGSQKGTNKVIVNRSKLKGLGIVPKAPTFEYFKGKENEKGFATITSTRDTAKSYHISTTGCQMNVADTERLEGILQNQLGLESISTASKADVILLNTCTIRDHAESKLYDALGPHAARKRKGEQLAIVVSGCVAQQEGEALLKRIPEIDLVMGPQYTSRLADLLEDVSRGHQVVATDPSLIHEDLSRPIRGHPVRAWVNVIHGCNEHCTYCVVPGVRGVEQSRTMENILKECLDLAEQGYKEVTLLGQNIDAYGRDIMPRRTFADLLTYLNENIPSGTIERIRYVTSHPRYFSDRVIDAVASLDKVCECFHMPFQSGDDSVLKDMRRGYTFESYMSIIRKIRKIAGVDASICGDVIVGFPGEDDAAFQRTLDLMEEVKFDNLNTFAYSPRPNTEAANWENQVPDEVKSERLQIVQRLAAQHALERSERYVGHTVEILVEDRNPKNMEQVMGRTRQGRQVFFDGDINELRGEIVDVEILEARTWSLVGKMITA